MTQKHFGEHDFQRPCSDGVDPSSNFCLAGLTQKLFDGSWNAPEAVPDSNLVEFEKLPQTAVLTEGMVLYDIARQSLLSRSAITNEPTNHDAILEECNRIMVLNGYEDAKRDGKNGITYADLPKSWNNIRRGQEFKLYGEDLAKFSQQSEKRPGTHHVPEIEIVVDEPRHQADVEHSGDPADFFICQFRDKRFNPNGPSSSNDCGPASLAMIARYYDAQFTVEEEHNRHQVDSSDADPAALVSDVRFLMTGGRDHTELTSLNQIQKAAEKIGFNTSSVETLADLDAQLDDGKLVILSGNPKHYQKDLGLHYGIGGTIYDGGHFVTVVRREGDNYIVNDPASHRGPLTLSRQQLDTYMRPNDRGLAVYPS